MEEKLWAKCWLAILPIGPKESFLFVSSEVDTLPSLFQGSPGSGGIKGEPGDMGPQVHNRHLHPFVLLPMHWNWLGGWKFIRVAQL